MKAVKANKVYTITEAQKSSYLAQGYDIADDKGKVLEHAPTSTVSRAEYDKALAEISQLKAENAKLRGDDAKSKKKSEGKEDVPDS